MKSKFYLLAISLICWTTMSFGRQQTDFDLIIDQVFDDFQAGTSTSSLDANVGNLLNTLDTAGYWSNIDYSSNSQTAWEPVYHFNRLSEMAKAYSREGSAYYGDTLLKSRIIKASEYWLNLSPQPSSTNWFYRTITIPNAVGRMLVCFRKSPEGISQSLENDLINLMTKGVSLYNAPSKNGSNRTDVGQHYIIRGCLTENQTLLQNAIDFIGESIVIANGEGIQADGSYAAHGQQLYIYGYGLEFIQGIRNIAIYVAGTQYQIAPEKIAIFSNFVRNGFIKTSRGKYVDFNVFGRGVSRPNTGRANTSQVSKVKLFDLPAYTSFYDTVISRMNGSEDPSFGVQAEHFNYWNTDYAVHHRPGYMFGLRTVSTRTMKSEMGNGENLKGTYLTEGATYIAVNGDEYYNIFPAWEWNKVPGTTVPEITNYPTRSSWGTNPGKSAFVGGVSDGKYGANVFAMDDYNTQAKKAWFFFDDEIVCLGAGISSSASQKINTTMNQSLLDGDVVVSESGSIQTLSEGLHNYSSGLDWVWHDSVAYLFPQGGNIRLSNDVQTGNSYDINHSYYSSNDPISKDVFKLWIDHGLSPSNDHYEYIVVPGMNSAAAMSSYDDSNIVVLANTDSVQVVKHAALDIWQLAFYKAGIFEAEGVKVKVDKPLVLQLKGVSSGEVEVFAAEPTQSAGISARIGLEADGFDGMKMLDLEFPSGLMAGSTVSGTIDNNSPDYEEIEIPLGSIAIADAYVRGGSYESDNFPTGTLVVKKGNNAYDRESYIKFDISDLPSNTDSVWVRLYVKFANTTVTDTNWEFYTVEDSTWSETGITYLNKPAGITKIGEVQGMPAGSYVQLDASSAVMAAKSAGNSTFSLKIISTVLGGETDGQFASREETDVYKKPQLIIKEAEEVVIPAGVEAVADAFVRGGEYENNNYPTQDLYVKHGNGAYDRESYLKFDLSELPSALDSVQLRMYVTTGGTEVTSTIWEVFSVLDTTWTETGITYATKPESGVKIGEIQGATTGSYIHLTITDSLLQEIAVGQWLSLKMTSTVLGGQTDGRFSPREDANPDFRPQLIPYGTEPEEEPEEPEVILPLGVEAIADAFVRGGTYENTNYPTENLYVKQANGAYEREAYLKFDLSELPSMLDSVQLRMYVQSANTDVTNTNWAFHAVSDTTWTETSLTYATKPSGNVLLGEVSGIGGGNYVYLTISDSLLQEVSLGNWLSVKVTSTAFGGNIDVRFTPREHETAEFRPQLIPFVSEEESEVATPSEELTAKSPKGLVGKDLPNNKVLLYPNPLVGMATVKTELPFHSLVIRDHRGEVMLEETGLNTNIYELNLSGFKNGMYYLMIIGEDFVETKKAIKRN
ncbi:DNRLRE domain-containing protein [Echinicola sp. CAU 1574]|uniref:DNRLRE domain-containing protein n=1 Tax=Echinicola arenosa TaxID=2774144 RepID=A0ABR9AGA9_9BACT|nr:polysaccharide lyase family 8 super-sandwich domain-containing protein [Echinicola arenosa]MBD8487771.1 DNRLRE domain-containing protein [Echinicola arenosa]